MPAWVAARQRCGLGAPAMYAHFAGCSGAGMHEHNRPRCDRMRAGRSRKSRSSGGQLLARPDRRLARDEIHVGPQPAKRGRRRGCRARRWRRLGMPAHDVQAGMRIGAVAHQVAEEGIGHPRPGARACARQAVSASRLAWMSERIASFMMRNVARQPPRGTRGTRARLVQTSSRTMRRWRGGSASMKRSFHQRHSGKMRAASPSAGEPAGGGAAPRPRGPGSVDLGDARIRGVLDARVVLGDDQPRTLRCGWLDAKLRRLLEAGVVAQRDRPIRPARFRPRAATIECAIVAFVVAGKAEPPLGRAASARWPAGD